MTKTLHRQVCLSACVLLMSASAATAQSTVDPRTEAKGHFGFLYFTPRVALKEFGVDTNVFNNATEQSDFTFTAAPHIDLWVPFARRARLTTAVGTDLVYYQTYGSERSVDPEVKLRGDAFLGRVSPFAETSFLTSRQRPNFEIDARSRRNERSTAVGVDVRVTPKVRVELAARESDVEFEADATFNSVSLQEVLNRRTRAFSFAVRHTPTALTTFVLKGEKGEDRFEFSPLRDSSSIRMTPGVEFKPSALISGSAFVGFRRFTPESAALERFTGVVANATLGYRLRGSTRFIFTADRDLTYSYEPAQPYFVVDGYGLTVRRQIVGRLDASAGYQRHQYSYRNLVVPGEIATSPDRVDVTDTWTTSVGYRLGQGPRLGFGTIYRERQSNSPQYRNYDGFRFITTIDYDF
jgi:hypothetical protein